MKVVGDYGKQGYAHVQALVPREVAQAFLQALKAEMGPGSIQLSRVTEYVNLINRPAFEAYGHFWKPMLFFLWGLTPMVSQIVGRELLPTYDYLRIYRAGDICKVHSDRLSCEHSLSLTLGYSDGRPWALEVGSAEVEPSARVDDRFGADEAHAAIAMEVGDAVLYQGVHHRHGRTTPNPNAWSAHLFLHWVDRDGPYREHAFDGRLDPNEATFTFS